MATGRDVIRVLEGRKHFDEWWRGIFPEVREEIIAELDGLPGMEPSPPADDDD